MSKWINVSPENRMAMIQRVIETIPTIDETAAEKDWWVTAVLYAIFHTNIADYLLFKRLSVVQGRHKPK